VQPAGSVAVRFQAWVETEVSMMPASMMLPGRKVPESSIKVTGTVPKAFCTRDQLYSAPRPPALLPASTTRVAAGKVGRMRDR
jgi:hypothetical protein